MSLDDEDFEEKCNTSVGIVRYFCLYANVTIFQFYANATMFKAHHAASNKFQRRKHIFQHKENRNVTTTTPPIVET